MHFHQKSTQSSYGIKVLLILLITYSTWCNASLSPEEIAEAMGLAADTTPFKYCGKRLTEAMKTFCIPQIRNAILRSPQVKKSLDNNQEMEFEPFDIERMENYDDEELAKTRYRTSMDDLFSNDIPFMFPSQANRRRRRGIIDECCKRACYKNELIKYCPPVKG